MGCEGAGPPEAKFTDILPQRISFMGLRRHSFSIVSNSKLSQTADLFIHTKMKKKHVICSFILRLSLSDSYVASRVTVMVSWKSSLPSFIALDRLLKFPIGFQLHIK